MPRLPENRCLGMAVPMNRSESAARGNTHHHVQRTHNTRTIAQDDRRDAAIMQTIVASLADEILGVEFDAAGLDGSLDGRHTLELIGTRAGLRALPYSAGRCNTAATRGK